MHQLLSFIELCLTGTSCETSTHKKGETIPCSVQASQQTEGVTVTGLERRAGTLLRIFRNPFTPKSAQNQSSR